MISRGLLGSSLVLLGGLLTATLPPSTPVLRLGLLEQLRVHEAGRMLGLVTVLIGLGLLAGAWLRLCRVLAVRDRGTAAPGEGVALVRFATAVWAAPLLIAPPLFSRDGWSYAAQGMLAHVGLSPYHSGPGALVPESFFPLPGWLVGPPVVQAVDPMWFDTAAPYGPVPLAFGSVVAGVTGNPWILVVAHRGLALLGLLLLAWSVPRLARWTGVDPALTAALVLASPLMLANGVAGLHNDLLVVGLMAAALVVAAERGWVLGAVVAGLAAGVKVPGGLVCVGIVLVTLPAAAGVVARLRRTAAVGAVAVGTVLVLGVVTGLGNGWLGALMVPGSVNTPLSATTLVGGAVDWVAHLAHLGTPPATFRDIARGLGLLAALAIGAHAVLRRASGDRSAALSAVAVTVTAFVVLSPVVHIWYLLLVTPFVAVLRLPRAGVGAFVAVSMLFGLVAPLDSSLHGAYYAIVVGVMTVSLLLPVLLLTPAARERIAKVAAVLAPPVPAPAAAATSSASGASGEPAPTEPQPASR